MSALKEMIVTIMPDGEIKIETKGFTGKACVKETEAIKALLGEKALKLLGYFIIHPRANPVEKLDHLHLGAEPPPNRAELKSDYACTNHQKPLGNRRQR